MKTILIAIDFSEETGLLVDAGLKMAKAFGAQVMLVHTEPPETGYVVYGQGMPPNVAGFYSAIPSSGIEKRHQMAIENAQHALDLLKRQFIDNKIIAETILMEGDVARALIELSNRNDIDLLIIGNHKHGRFYNFIFNDIGQNIISHADCNVLVIETECKKTKNGGL